MYLLNKKKYDQINYIDFSLNSSTLELQISSKKSLSPQNRNQNETYKSIS